MTHVDPEELAALRGAQEAAQHAVLERDFARPLRLGTERVGALRRRIEAALPDLAARFSEALGRPFEVALHDVREVHAAVAAEGLKEPLAALRFTAAGQVGWAVWEREAAVRAVETLLCGTPSRRTSRALSDLETALVGGALQGLAEGVARVAGIALADATPVRDLLAFAAGAAAGPAPDPHRVAVDLGLASAKEESALVLYLPGLAAKLDERPAPPAELPGHLEPVDVEISARLGETDVPLSDLLGIEPGDVIPLGRGSELRLAVTVDGWTFAHGVLGRSEGRLAVRLTDFHPSEKEQR